MSEEEEDDPCLTFDQAVALLPDGDRIHTFRQGGPALIGADWDRDAVLEAIRTHGAELAGEHATKAGHGIVVFTGERRHSNALFVQTRGGAS